jgi:5-methylcytosine-specific restriction endonuclease McrA
MRRDRYTCRVCGTRARRQQLEVDHIREIARGGASLDYDNLQTLCKSCHRRKTSEFLRSRGRRFDVPDALDSPAWFPA